METATFPPTLEQLPTMLRWIRKHLVDQGVDAKSANRLELASEEALVNSIQHGYGGKKSSQQEKIEIELTITPERVQIAIRDWGIPYDPLAKPPQVDLDASLDQREPGGLGIHLLRELMDEVAYHREGTANCLILIKHFSRRK